MVAHYKLLIAKLKREQYGQSSERGRKLIDQLELQLEELEASAAEAEAASEPADGTSVISFTRKRPVRAPFPAHLPRERVVIEVVAWAAAVTPDSTGDDQDAPDVFRLFASRSRLRAASTTRVRLEPAPGRL